jgi:hypothetical protein
MMRFLICIVVVAANQISFGQDIGVNLSDITAGDKKTVLNIGALAGGVPTSNNLGFGGCLKVEQVMRPKFGLGIKAIVGGTKRLKLEDGGAPNSWKIEGPNSYMLCDLTATYFILGDYLNSKGGLYTEFGLGYQSATVNYNYQNYYYSTGTETYMHSGLGSHAVLGGNYNLVGGKVYLEMIFGGVVYGTGEEKWTGVTPSALPPLNVPTYNKSTGLWAQSMKKNSQDPFMCLWAFNLGYSFVF